jgi:hypothetical protein
MMRLDTYRPEGFAQAVAAANEHRTTAPGALAQVQSTIDRLGKRFEWGHFDEAAYRAEHERLRAVQSELAAAVTPAANAINLEGLLDAWLAGGPAIRRELLGRLFDALHVEDGQIVAYSPRKDTEAEVAALVSHALAIEQDMGKRGAGGI